MISQMKWNHAEPIFVDDAYRVMELRTGPRVAESIIGVIYTRIASRHEVQQAGVQFVWQPIVVSYSPKTYGCSHPSRVVSPVCGPIKRSAVGRSSRILSRSSDMGCLTASYRPAYHCGQVSLAPRLCPRHAEHGSRSAGYILVNSNCSDYRRGQDSHDTVHTCGGGKEGGKGVRERGRERKT